MKSTTAAVKAEPVHCYDCSKRLRWIIRDTPVGYVGLAQCCGADYLFHDDDTLSNVKKFQKDFGPRTVAVRRARRSWLPVAIIAAAILIPLLLVGGAELG